MFSNAKASEQVAVVGVIDPDANTATSYNTGYIDMSKWEEVMFVVMAGDLGSSATLDFKVTEYTDASGSNGHDITGKAITQLTQVGTDDNKQVVVNLRREELTLNSSLGYYRYVRGIMAVGTATSDSGVIALGLIPREAPASDNDIATVDEIV